MDRGKRKAARLSEVNSGGNDEGNSGGIIQGRREDGVGSAK
jgi:hypothetical protein